MVNYKNNDTLEYFQLNTNREALFKIKTLFLY